MRNGPKDVMHSLLLEPSKCANFAVTYFLCFLSQLFAYTPDIFCNTTSQRPLRMSEINPKFRFITHRKVFHLFRMEFFDFYDKEGEVIMLGTSFGKKSHFFNHVIDNLLRGKIFFVLK